MIPFSAGEDSIVKLSVQTDPPEGRTKPVSLFESMRDAWYPDDVTVTSTISIPR